MERIVPFIYRIPRNEPFSVFPYKEYNEVVPFENHYLNTAMFFWDVTLCGLVGIYIPTKKHRLLHRRE
jgi:hypothetical protein